MNAQSILADLARAGFRVEARGDKIRISPSAVPPALLATVKARKPELLDYLRGAANGAADLSQYPVADGPFTPYIVPLSAERVSALLGNLRAAISKLADTEKWTDNQREQLLAVVARQPISTLADDLSYFQQRLSAIEAVAHTTEVMKRINEMNGQR